MLALALLRAAPAKAVDAEVPTTPRRDAVIGTLRTAGTREPIPHARVMVVPADPAAPPGIVALEEHLDPATDPVAWVRSVETDEAGRFELGDIEEKRLRIIVVAAGHARHEEIVDVARTPRRGFVLFVSPDEASAFRTVIESRAEQPPERVKSTSMSAEEIQTAPGTQGDPLRALQNLPGVARSPGGLGILVLRGASPNQSRVFMGGHALPRAFHSLAISSVVPAAAIDRMEFVPSNFDARFGDATGGVVLLHPAQLQREGVHGYGRLDLLGGGAVASGPLKKGAYLVAAQRGWADGVLRLVERVNPALNLLMPRYYDYQAFFEYPVARRGTLVARALGAGDRIQARMLDPNASELRATTGFEVVSQFHRADLSYRVRHGPWSFWLTPSVRFERNGTQSPLTGTRSIRDDVVFSARAEASRPLSRRVGLLVGADVEVDRYRANFRRPYYLVTGEDPEAYVVRGVQSSLGVYGNANIRLQRWQLSPGVRVSAFTLGPTSKAAVDPRINAHWSFAPRWRWSMGAGLYSQARIQQTTVSGYFLTRGSAQTSGNLILPASLLSLEPRSGFLPADGALEVARAVQVSTAMSRTIGESWFVEVGAWGRMRTNADGLSYSDDGTVDVVTSTWSSAYGLEVLARRMLGPKLWGWVGYTLSRADVHVLDRVGPATTPNSRPTDFDQRHNLVVLASYRLPRRWRIGGRFRLVSGSPFTDVVGTVWTPAYTPVPGWGARNGERFPLFHQLDVRVDKSWVRKRVEVGTYIDVQNVYNHVNPEAYIYDYTYSRRTEAIGLPVFPSLGIRIDY